MLDRLSHRLFSAMLYLNCYHRVIKHTREAKAIERLISKRDFQMAKGLSKRKQKRSRSVAIEVSMS